MSTWRPRPSVAPAGGGDLWPDVSRGRWSRAPRGAPPATRRDYRGPPPPLVAKGGIAEPRRAFRAFRAHVPDDRRASSHGAFHIDLSPPAVDRLRRRRPVTVIMSVRARTPDIHFAYHDVLRFRLARRA